MNRFFRAAALLWASSVIGAGLLSGCGPGAPAISPKPGQTSQPAADGPLSPMKNPVELTCVVGFNAAEDTRTPAGTTPENQSFNTILYSKLNINLKYLWCVSLDQFETKLNLTVSSGVIPDIMSIRANEFFDFMENGILADLGQAYGQYALPGIKQDFERMGDAPLAQCTRNSQLLAVPYCADTTQQIQLLYLRQDWLDALHLALPKTMDDVERIAVAFAHSDPDGNGVDDTTGLGLYRTIYNYSMDASGLFQGYGAYPGKWLLRDGKLVSGTTQPEVYQALARMRDIYQNGGINREFAVTTADQLTQMVIGGKVGMLYGEWWLPNWPLNSSMQKDPKVEWTVCPIVTPDGSPAKSIVDRNVIGKYNVVSIKAPAGSLVAAIKLMNLWWDMQYNAQSASIYGDAATPAGGYVYNWVPIYPYQANEQIDNYKMVNSALESGNPAQLTTKMQKDLYGASQSWLKDGIAGKDGWKNWGLWYSRVAQGGSWGLTVSMKETGQFIYNEYYGRPTPTELEKSEALTNLTMDFFNGFIMGNGGDDAWDKFVGDWNKLGGDMWTEEVNRQYIDIQNGG